MLKRSVVAAGLIALLAAVLYFGGWVQLAVFTCVTVISVYEMGGAYRARGIRVFLLPAYLFAGLYYPLYRLLGTEWVAGLLLVAFLLTAGERVLGRNRSTEEALIGISMLLYPLLLYVMLMYLGEFKGHATSRVALLSAFAMPLMGDTMAYCFGRAFGKRKLAPGISPNKTVAGSIAGVLGGALGGCLVHLMQALWRGVAIPLVPLLITGFACGISGQIGDLFASAIKRWANVKDYGRIFPGHGGVMDRLDSVLFSAPVVLFAFSIMM